MRRNKFLTIILMIFLVLGSFTPGFSVHAEEPFSDASDVSVAEPANDSNGTWKQTGGRWWYEYSDGSYAQNEYIDGRWLDANGWNDSKWNGSWKKNRKGKWFQAGSWYPTNRWLKIDHKWYYFGASGYIARSKWMKIGSSWYYLKQNGQMAVSEKVGKYEFDSEGKWIDNKPLAQYVAESETAKKTTQIITVVDHDLILWKKQKDGSWKAGKTMYCGYGENGFCNPETRVAGTRTTPKGSYELTVAFGTAPNPGTKMKYRKITPYSYWSAEEATYNTWVESKTPISGEHLIDYYQYKYAMNIGYNLNPTVYGRGAAIFLHCKSTNTWCTGGCVSLEEKNMVSVMKQLKKGAYIMIAEDKSELENY